jgi:3-isopropylmalate/(R)-2-methylmalate dehydratase small subunit
MTIEWVRTGRTWRFGDHVSIEQISPLRFMLAPKGRGRACMKSLRPDFAEAEKEGDLIVAGRMFGHGPGHDHAILAIREAGVVGVVATSFAPQFFRHAIGHGLLVAQCSQAVDIAADGDVVSVDFNAGRGRNTTTGVEFTADVPAGPARDIIAAGGLVPFLRARLNAGPAHADSGSEPSGARADDIGE